MSDPKTKIQQLEQRIKELEKDNKILSDFADLSSDWFWEQNSELRFTRFFGLSTEKLQRDQKLFLGKRRWDMPICDLSEKQLQAHIDCCMNHQSFRDFEYEVPGDDNSLQRYSISGTPFYDDQGEFAGYRGIGRNITELRSAQNAVKESQQKLLQILLGSPIPTFVIDSDHVVTHWNPACANLTGIEAKDIIGKKESWKGFYREERPTMADLVVAASPTELVRHHYGNKFSFSNLIPGACEAEAFFPQMGSNGLWLHFNASPLKDINGHTVGAIETLQDVSSRVKAEQTERKHYKQLQASHLELQRTMQQLVEAQKLAGLGRLAAGVGHELNTPLGNILMGQSVAQAMLDDLIESFDEGQLSRKQLDNFITENQNALSIIDSNLKRCTSLINRFKEMANDQNHTESVPFSPHEVMNDVYTLSAHECQKKNIRINNLIPADLSITSYKEAFEQIMFSLLENSITHGIASSGEVEVQATRRNNNIEIKFQDNGCGMDEEALKHAFDPFFSTQFGQGSSGLGLYRVYNLITVVMGGSITLENTSPGLCARFNIHDEDL
ncbi:PAS domain-containing sensor histidine kinase [Neptuniibacter sp.]|uniref:PAS domain-containing sensor histidine kinase n=1 Tax=Neptuniibacter sp. TaxID=1962643 RepID=UPI002624C976|nr:PAS domain-containing sensor histidine kinase [Neptuniibacter sp.]MCP4597199.1 PAS domain-containing sensor histidine kinase [Neptuniibacter sp.]